VIEITIHFDSHVEGYRVAAELLDRFGPERIAVEASNGLHSDAEDEVDAEMLVTILRGAQARLGISGAELVQALAPTPLPVPKPEPRTRSGPINVSPRIDPLRDGAPRAPFPRPRTQGGTPTNKRAREWLWNTVACPKCGELAGTSCLSPNGTHYGNHTVHTQRIDAVRWSDE
jgi:hypothetical protein